MNGTNKFRCRRVLVVRLDGIGDYILWRNTLRFIRYSAAYRDAHFTLLGNPAWRSFFDSSDFDCSNECIWVNRLSDLFRKSRENFMPKAVWHRRVAHSQAVFRKPLIDLQFDEVLSLRSSRDPLLDSLVSGLAPSVVGVRGPSGDDSAYTRLLDPGPDPFAFLQNRCAASDLTGEPCFVPLEFCVSRQGPIAPRLMLFPGASHWTRRWPLCRFSDVARRFLARGNGTICVAGGPADAIRIRSLTKRIGHAERVAVWEEHRSLSELAAEMANCTAVVTNDTMALHLAAAVGTPAVGIVNGFSGRDGYWPYPESLGKRIVICGGDAGRPENTFSTIVGRQVAMVQHLLSVHVIDVCRALASIGVPC